MGSSLSCLGNENGYIVAITTTENLGLPYKSKQAVECLPVLNEILQDEA
jgi:hypothetical protein